MTNSNIIRHNSHVSPQDRAALLGQTPATIWMTGLSSAGKSTLAFALERKLIGMGKICCVLDGDNVRHGLNRDLGFSIHDRSENIRRIAEVAKLMNEAGLIVITAFISPFRNDRAMARDIIGAAHFREVYISTPIAECERRDPKSLYQRARSGRLPEFTGISSPYEAPDQPALDLDTSALDTDAAVDHLIALLK